jgi:hypothetical protein
VHFSLFNTFLIRENCSSLITRKSSSITWGAAGTRRNEQWSEDPFNPISCIMSRNANPRMHEHTWVVISMRASRVPCAINNVYWLIRSRTTRSLACMRGRLLWPPSLPRFDYSITISSITESLLAFLINCGTTQKSRRWASRSIYLQPLSSSLRSHETIAILVRT